ncbi:MAG: small, acid-soluble spore protein, alpha/beta type [Desulfitobacteriaceae bacterium]|nr:small, acid-soluble spore protein, alpha/beta type [Desulfitobacteriaceae bacterium]MDD4346312.1 small, acid-soluble spore protein, alpha/beta type [Desulfitobacteriaceae bacterium]MDD4400550.1 small, acid-soluble spore protein, alpha/beta type [Desulfitobacteriaceae bacterium]
MQDKPKIPLTPEMERFKYEVAQEIRIANRKHKKVKASE